MSIMLKMVKVLALVLSLIITVVSCKKLVRPTLGSYAQDQDPKFPLYPGGPLKFYSAFEGTGTDVLRNAVDSVRANFPSSNPLASITGINGKAIQGSATSFINYASANDFPQTAKSFSISFWEKRNGIPNGNASFLFTIPSANKQWGGYGFSMFLLFDWGTWTPASSAIVKFYMVDDNCHCDNWLTWEGGNKVPNLQDNSWHHMVFVYDASTSNLTLYVDGVANPNVAHWGTHGSEIIDASKVQGLDIGGNRNIPNLGWGMNWDGGLDQFRMYSKVLTTAEIQALYVGKL